MILLRKLVDFLLYSNLFIAICASSLAYQTLVILDQFSWKSSYVLLIFFATFFIYSIHRLIGFGKLERTANNRRINVILSFQNHIILYAIVTFIGLIVSLFYISPASLIWLGAPAVLAFVYVLPIFGNKKRFRDLPFIKIFAIGIAWIWVCVFIPIIDHHEQINLYSGIFLLEKFLFIIGITLPFDIRDLNIDRLHQIKTIPILLGELKSKILAISLITISWFLTTLSCKNGLYSTGDWIALSISYLFTGIIISLVSQKSHDYYFTGLLDGSILLQFILILIFS